MSDHVEGVVKLIEALSVDELRELKMRLTRLWEGGEPDAGTREPRRPTPPDDEAAASVIPERSDKLGESTEGGGGA